MQVRVSGWVGLVHQVSVPAKRASAVGYPPATTFASQVVLAAIFPDKRYAAADTGNLGRLDVRLDRAITEVQSQLFLFLRRNVLVAED